MNHLSNSLAVVVIGVLALVAVAPTIIGLSQALVPVLIVGAIAVIAVRLVFFHTRRW